MSSAPPDQLIVTSTIPAVSETTAPGPQKLTVIFNANVDSSRVSTDVFTLRDAADQSVPLAAARVPLGRQNMVELTTAQPLAAGSYQLAVHGDGPAPLTGEAGHVLDGDADGKPGGDKLIPFDVNAGGVR
jgi:methionine-rich copper-binding protein CopC